MTTIDDIAIRPGDAEYDAARTTIAGTAEPAVVLRPSDTAEVVAALEYVREAGLELAVRSGGHNALGFGNSDGGAVLDVSRSSCSPTASSGSAPVPRGARPPHGSPSTAWRSRPATPSRSASAVSSRPAASAGWSASTA